MLNVNVFLELKCKPNQIYQEYFYDKIYIENKMKCILLIVQHNRKQIKK